MRHARSIVLFVASVSLLACAPTQEQQGGIVLVVLDTVRADHLSCYGYERETTPHFDQLASEGERYDEAYAQSSWTLPAMATILTGQPPHIHGAGRGSDAFYPVREEVTTVAERLSEAGYRTAAFVNVVWCDPDSGLARGFERYDHQTSDETNQGQRTAGETTTAALEWAGELDGEPFFLVVHYFDPHLTYDPPAPYDTIFEPEGGESVPKNFGTAGEVRGVRKGEISLSAGQRLNLIARYDGELRYTDHEFGRLRQGLEALGLWDESLVLVVGDHGEEFWDHGGFEHGHSHFREMLRVPLIVRRPGATAGLVNGDRVRQLDIAPTLLDFAGVQAEADLPGRKLGSGSAAYSVAEGVLWGGETISVRSDRGTLIWNRATGERLYFEPGDPEEQRPVAASDRPEELAALLESLPAPRSGDDLPWEPTEDQLRQLRSLGYLD